MLQQPDLWDALAISTWPDGTPSILEVALDLDVPILVEKPVAWNSTRLKQLCTKPHSQVIVGYNRRFYRAVQAARQEALDGPPLLAHLMLPTELYPVDRYDSSGRYMQSFYESVSALGLDLTRFIMGDLKIEAVHRHKDINGNIAGLAATLSTERKDILQVTGNWATAANFSLTLNRPGRRFELLPFEIANVYEGMEVLPASDEYPIRRYVPKLIKQIILDGIDLEEKPGFVGETMALRAMIEGGSPPEFTARLEDALAVMTLCEQLTGVMLGEVNPNPDH
jgi:predicted dehydrogenase